MRIGEPFYINLEMISMAVNFTAFMRVGNIRQKVRGIECELLEDLHGGKTATDVEKKI
jgi:hypothetical protein